MSTYQPILEYLAAPSKSAGILQLSTPVHRVSISSDQIFVGTKTGEYLADAVILTVPLGCLKRSTIQFSPPLPRRIQSAIQNLGYGNLEKLFLRFERPWWIASPEQNPPNS